MLNGMSNAKHVRHKSRLGASRNMQYLFSLARGKYIAHIDGDDYWFEEKLQRQIDFLDCHSECVAVYSNALVVDDEGHELAIFNDAGDAIIDLTTLMSRGNFLNNSSMMLRSELVPAFVAIDHPFLDFEGHLLHAQEGYLGHLGDVLVAYRIGAQGSLVSTSNEIVREAYFQGILSVDRSKVATKTMVLAFADFLRRVAFRSIRTGNVKLLMHWWRRVVKHVPGRRLHLLLSTCLAIANEFWRLLLNAVLRKRAVLYRS